MITKMSYELANSIVDKYIKLVGKKIENSNLDFRYYRYSDLDFNDFSNAAKLIVAFRFYNNNPNTYKYANWADEGLVMYPYDFISDEKYNQLTRLIKDSSDYLKLRIEISNSQISDCFNYFGESETVSSFLNFCKQIYNDDFYWHKVFERINLKCDIEKDDYFSFLYRKEESQINKNTSVDSSHLNKKKRIGFLSAVNRLFKNTK